METRRPTPNVERAPLVEWRAQHITDPVERLRYLRQAMQEKQQQQQQRQQELPPGSPRASILERLRQRLPVSNPSPLRWVAGGVGCLVLLISGRMLQTGASASVSHGLPVAATTAARASLTTVSKAAGVQKYTETPIPKVWLVEKRDEYETYSNGLRIDNAYRTETETRRYPRFRRMEANGEVAEWSDAPAGLVYHTTEGQIVPFEAEQNKRLIKIGANLLSFIKKAQAYNFVVDRFGRVFRVVQESDTAYHAGHSVWADSQWAYVELNHSFLGIAFESRTEPAEPVITAAQVTAGRTLTEMLRSQYKIASSNCVTHAQVSVNSSNMLIGNHTDWAGNFPFAELGLPSNYDVPLPSLYTFGFGYDSYFVKATGNKPWRGVQLADERVRREAAEMGLAPGSYRELLRERYKKLVQTVKNGDAGEEKGDDRSE